MLSRAMRIVTGFGVAVACVVGMSVVGAEAVTTPGTFAAVDTTLSVSAVIPNSGPAAGGTMVRILGSGFDRASVRFGATSAPRARTMNRGVIEAETPAGTPGTVDVVVTNRDGSTATLPGGFLYTAGSTTNPPPAARMLRPTAAVTLSTSIPVAWTGTATGATIASYQVQRAVKAPGGALGAYANWGAPGTATSGVMAAARRGYGYCFRVQAADSTGAVSAWSAPRCSTVAGDDRVLAGRVGWARPVVRTAYLRTLTTSRTRGATLVLAKSRGSALVLVVNKVPGGGTLGVYVKGKKVATVPTTARRAALKVLVTLRVRTAGVPVVLRLDAPGTRGVAIDGIAQLP